MREEKSGSRSHTRFLGLLSANLHQMAQPLSVVQANLELSLLKRTTAKEYRAVTKEALEQLHKTVTVLQFTGQLARFQQPAADAGEAMLSRCVDEAIADLRRVFEAAGVTLIVSQPGRELPVQASSTRLRQMLFYLLQAAHAVSQPGDVVRVETGSNGPGSLRIYQSRQRGKAKPAGGDVRVDQALALAEAIVLNAGGSFEATLTPLRIEVSLDDSRLSRGPSHKEKLKHVAGLQSASSQQGAPARRL